MCCISRHYRGEARSWTLASYGGRSMLGNRLFIAVGIDEHSLFQSCIFLIVYSFLSRATLPLTILVNPHFPRFAAGTGRETIKSNLSKGDKPWTYFGP